MPVEAELALVDWIKLSLYIVRPQTPPVALIVISDADLTFAPTPSSVNACSLSLVPVAVTEIAPKAIKEPVSICNALCVLPVALMVIVPPAVGVV